MAPNKVLPPRLQERLRVSPRAERHVDHGSSTAEESDDLVRHDRLMPGPHEPANPDTRRSPGAQCSPSIPSSEQADGEQADTEVENHRRGRHRDQREALSNLPAERTVP